MAIKIYSEGGTVIIDDGDEIQISSFSYYEGENETITIVNNDKQTNAWNDFYYNIQTKEGVQAGVTMALTLDYLSIVAGASLINQVVVNQTNFASTIGGTIDSTKDYFLDGIIDIGTTQITIPETGITITGYSFDLSGLVSTENNYTMFIDSSGSGNVLMTDIFITTSGTLSQVYDLTDSNGFHAIEMNRVNYIDCTSLGELTNYRQGLELGTGRFGGSPSLTLSGTWIGGFVVLTSIVRSMSDTTIEPLFKTGTAFTMLSRFKTDMNVDLGTLQPLFDFATSNFTNSSTLQLEGCLISRDGVFDSTDTNITPNITHASLSSKWSENIGVPNTHIGGHSEVTTETETVITTVGVYETLNGTFTAEQLQHFDTPSNGQLRNLGTTHREFSMFGNVNLDSAANEDISLRVRKWDNSASVFVDLFTQSRQINNFSGGRDVGFFNFHVSVTLDVNDYVFLQTANQTGTNNVTAELGSHFKISVR
tara:strand:+ start:5939 stop:7378 length:1440 start_codon:yes stop_codon:yes gene_type:complete